MKTLDVIVVGELNLDIIMNDIQGFPSIGKEILANKMTLTLGSSAAIFASNLSSLGAKVGFIGKLGKDHFGEFILDELQGVGVRTEGIQQGELPTGATFVMNFGEDRANITYRGVMETLTFSDIPQDLLGEARHLHFSSYFFQPGLQKDLDKLLKFAKSAGLTTSFDAQWDPAEQWNSDLAELLPYTDIFLPNEKEAIKLTHSTCLDQAIKYLRGFNTTTIIKMGSKGSLSISKRGLLHLPAYINPQTVDAIGAGDSFNAGFIYKFLQRVPLEECQDFGNLMGAICTTAAGGTAAFKDPLRMAEIAKAQFGYNLSGIVSKCLYDDA